MISEDQFEYARDREDSNMSRKTEYRLPPLRPDWTHLVDVLAFQLGNQLFTPGFLDLDSTSFQKSGDVGDGGSGVSTEGEEEVGSDVLHFCETKQIARDGKRASERRQRGDQSPWPAWQSSLFH